MRSWHQVNRKGMFRISFVFGVLREKVQSPLCLFQRRQSSHVRSAKDSFPRCMDTKKTRSSKKTKTHVPSGLVHSQRQQDGKDLDYNQKRRRSGKDKRSGGRECGIKPLSK